MDGLRNKQFNLENTPAGTLGKPEFPRKLYNL